MTEAAWAALVPHLPRVASLDLSGGGEPLLQPRLAAWVAQGKAAGCEVGLLSNGLLLDQGRAAELIAAGLDWLGISLDGASAESYQAIRVGGDFARLLANLRGLARLRPGGRPRLILQMVLMAANFGELAAMVELAAGLGADQLNLKQYDVIRGEPLAGEGLVVPRPDRASRRRQKALRRALDLAARRGLAATAFPFVPEEMPVCGMDPRQGFFVAFDGRIAPCIGLAYGGSSRFLGRPVEQPTTGFGRLPDHDPWELWATSPAWREFRASFARRERVFDQALARADPGGRSLAGLERAYAQARAALPPAPPGCAACPYLFGV